MGVRLAARVCRNAPFLWLANEWDASTEVKLLGEQEDQDTGNRDRSGPN